MNPLLLPKVLARVKRGEPLVGGAGLPRSIQGQHVAEFLIEQGASIPRLHLSQCDIVGDIALNSCRPTGGTEFPAIIAEQCTITGSIDLSHTICARLSLKESRIVRLIAVGAEFKAELELSQIASAEAPGAWTGYGSQATCQVDLRGARVHGELRLIRSTLTAPKDHPFEIESRTFNYALDLRGALIEGDLLAQPGFQALGGVDLDGAEVRGMVWLTGAHLRAGTHHALSLQSAHVGGSVVLRATRTDEAVQAPLVILGALQLRGLEVDREFYLLDALVGAKGAAEFVIEGIGMKVHGRALFSGAVIGSVWLTHAAFGGELSLGNGTLPDGLNVAAQFHTSGGARRTGLTLEDASVAGDFNVRNLTVDDPIERFLRLFNQIAFADAQTCALRCYPGWSLGRLTYHVHQSRCYAYLLYSKRAAYLLDGASVRFLSLNASGGLRLDDDQQVEEYVRLFCLSLRGPAGAFRIAPRTAANPPDATPFTIARDEAASRVRITTHMEYDDALMRVTLSVSTAAKTFGEVEMVEDQTIGDSLQRFLLDPPFVRVVSPAGAADAETDPFWPDGWTALDPAKAEDLIERAVKDKGRARPLRGRIDLSGLSVRRLDDLRGTAFGRRALLNLNGFTYDSFVDNRGLLEINLVGFQEQAVYNLRRTLLLKAAVLPIALLLWGFSWLSWLCSPLVWLILAVRRLRRALDRLASPVAIPPRRPVEPAFTRQTGTQFARMLRSGRYGSYEAAVNNLSGEWRWRLMWLGQQHLNYKADPMSYRPQPYQQAVEAFVRGGKMQDAKRLQSRVLTLERRFRTYWLWRPLAFIYAHGFDYGLSPGRAAVTVLICIGLGWWGTVYLNTHGMLVTQTMPTAPVALVAAGAPGQPQAAAPGVEISRSGATIRTYACGDAISELIYAVDVFIPLLDLKQEERCDIIAASDFSPPPLPSVVPDDAPLTQRLMSIGERLLRSPTAWSIAKAIYAIGGWIVISLAILTFTGILRKTALDKG